MSLLQGRNKEADTENGLDDKEQEGKAGVKYEQHRHIHTTERKIFGWWEAAAQHREIGSVLCDDLEGQDREEGREAQEGGDMCMHMADSFCYATETNAVL